MLPCASRDAGLEAEVAKRIVMAASRLLGVTAACVILFSFAAGQRNLYWNGCIKSAIVICQRIFPILALVIFRLKLFLKSASKSSFSSFGVEIRRVVLVRFDNSVSADRILMAASRLLGATAACAILLSLSVAAGHRKS